MKNIKDFDIFLNEKKAAEEKEDKKPEKEEAKEPKGLTPKQKKLPKALQDAILKKQGKQNESYFPEGIAKIISRYDNDEIDQNELIRLLTRMDKGSLVEYIIDNSSKVMPDLPMHPVRSQNIHTGSIPSGIGSLIGGGGGHYSSAKPIEAGRR